MAAAVMEVAARAAAATAAGSGAVDSAGEAKVVEATAAVGREVAATAAVGTAAVGTAGVGTGAAVKAAVGTAAVGTAEAVTAAVGTAEVGTAEAVKAAVGTAGVGTGAAVKAVAGTAEAGTAGAGTGAVGTAAVGTAAADWACAHRHTHKYGTQSATDAMSESMLRVGMKRCNGCKWLSVDCFATNPKTNELYSKCVDCKLKSRASGHAKRDADLKKQKAALAAGETPETLICNGCGRQAFGAFGINADTGMPYDNCESCHVKMLGVKAAYKQTEAGKATAKRYSDSEKGKAADERYAESEKGKERDKRYAESAKGKAVEKRYAESAKGKATQKRYAESAKGKAVEKRYAESDAGKATQKRYREGDAGQETAKRFADNRQDRRRASPAMQMDHAIQCASNRLISGRHQASPKFIARTGFASETAFLAAVEATFAPGMTFANHGHVWELDHKIPREAYDFDDPEDVKRCWSPKNVHALTKAANLEKSWKLVDQYVAEAGVETFPVAWNGQFPDADVKIAHAAKMLARKILEDEAAVAAEQPSGSNDFGPIEAPDSE